MLKKIIVFLFLLSVSSLSSAESPDPLQTFLHDFKTLKANFTQTLLNENGEPLEKTTGVLYLKQPGKFHWSYKKPYVQQIISNGESLWIYDEDLEQVTIRNLGNSIEQTPAGIILGQSKLDKHFVQMDLGNIEGYDWVELTPRNPEAQYKDIRIGFDKNKLGMMIIDDNLGQTTRIDFKNVEKNSKLSAKLFSFEIPNDVDVIDERLTINTE